MRPRNSWIERVRVGRTQVQIAPRFYWRPMLNTCREWEAYFERKKKVHRHFVLIYRTTGTLQMSVAYFLLFVCYLVSGTS